MGLFRRNKNNNKPVIRQIIDLVPHWLFNNCTDTYKTDKGCSKYKTYDQFVALTYGQLYKCHTLSDISTGIGVSETFISDLGLKQSPARSTMSDGNKKRDWRVFESLYYKLLSHYHFRMKVIQIESIDLFLSLEKSSFLIFKSTYVIKPYHSLKWL